MQSLLRRAHPLSSTAEQVKLLEGDRAVPAFAAKLKEAGLPALAAGALDVMQVNVGKLCNQTCRHCHVDAGPDRTEVMTRETFELCLAALRKSSIPTVDITGGAPELNPDFRWFVTEVKKLGRHVMDRCNLTILDVQKDLAEFLAANEVEIIASLPYWSGKDTDAQRGAGVFDRSIAGLKRLNALGYGGRLKLNLVYNPAGAYLPASQKSLERDFKRELQRRHGITFHSLYTITNMPISRFLEFLADTGNFEAYIEKLANAFNPAAVPAVMCRSMISVGWDGRLFDCDFNQMLDLETGFGAPRHIRDFDEAALAKRRIVTGRHCYGCTAGAGSSCGGATA
ncbi:MAG: arsenosugar biosynthesis radical SAM protein ArsS [Planctomycetia bacterium]|nr:arsenosugar biosynthesis radical SAM protein ArsS [Planctomycetia bacterium]